MECINEGAEEDNENRWKHTRSTQQLAMVET